LDWGDLIQIADPDALSNSAKQEIEMDKQLFHREVRLGSASNFETFLTVRKLSTPADTVELKFETAFAGAKDPHARQTKAQFYISSIQLSLLQATLAEVTQESPPTQQPPAGRNHEKLRSWRESLALTENEAANLLGVDESAYNGWELGITPIKERVLLACSSVCKIGQNKNPIHKPIIKAIKEYKEAYKYYLNTDPAGKHLIPTPWTSLKYGVFDLSPAGDDQS